MTTVFSVWMPLGTLGLLSCVCSFDDDRGASIIGNAAVWAIHYTSNSDILCSTAVAVPLELTLSQTEIHTTLLRIQERRQVGQELGKLSLLTSNIHPICPRGMNSKLWLNTAIGDAFVQNIC